MLDAATHQRDTTLSGLLNNKLVSLKSANNSLASTIKTLCDDNTRVCEKLNEALCALSEAMTDAEHLHTDKDTATEQANITISELYDKIRGLNEQIDDLEHGRSPDRMSPP